MRMSYMGTSLTRNRLGLPCAGVINLAEREGHLGVGLLDLEERLARRLHLQVVLRVRRALEHLQRKKRVSTYLIRKPSEHLSDAETS